MKNKLVIEKILTNQANQSKGCIKSFYYRKDFDKSIYYRKDFDKSNYYSKSSQIFILTNFVYFITNITTSFFYKRDGLISFLHFLLGGITFFRDLYGVFFIISCIKFYLIYDISFIYFLDLVLFFYYV